MSPNALGGGVLLAVALAAAAPAGGKEPSPPLDNEAIVRLVAQRVSESDILRAIEDAAEVQFDLDPDVVVELQRVGVPEKVVAAMRRRQASAPVPASAPAAPQVLGRLEIRVAPAEAGKKPGELAVFQVIKKTPRWAANELGMLQRAEVEDLAFFVVCTRPDHVPDHWQDRTELKHFARHEKILFRPGSRTGKSKGFEVVILEFPEAISVDVPEGMHRLALGVAAKAGPDWQVLGSDDRDGVEIAGAATTVMRVGVGGKVAGSRMSGFTEEQAISIRELIPPGKAP